MAKGASARALTDRAQSLLGWVTLAVVLLSALLVGANRPLFWILLSALVIGLFLFQVILDAVRPAPPAKRLAVPLAFGYLCVVIWAGVQVHLPVPETVGHPVWALVPGEVSPRIGADPGTGRHVIMRLLAYGMVAWVFVSVALRSRDAWGMVQGIALFSTALALFGLHAVFTGENVIIGATDGQRTVVSASFINRNSYATYGAFGVLANLAAYMHFAGRSEGGEGTVGLRNFLESFFGGAWLYAFGILIGATAVALTASRAGGLAGLCGIVAFALVLGRSKGGAQWALWGIITLLIGFVVYALSSETAERLLNVGEDQTRFDVYRAVITQIWERPLLGHGIGAFQDAFRAHVPPDAAVAEWDKAHNTYLENIFELGIPAAAVLYGVLTILSLKILRGVRQRRSDKELPAFAFAVIVTAGVHSLFDFSLQMPATAALFAVILGIGWSQSFRQDARKPQKQRRSTQAL